jgi:hypothetical protein
MLNRAQIPHKNLVLVYKITQNRTKYPWYATQIESQPVRCVVLHTFLLRSETWFGLQGGDVGGRSCRRRPPALAPALGSELLHYVREAHKHVGISRSKPLQKGHSIHLLPSRAWCRSGNCSARQRSIVHHVWPFICRALCTYVLTLHRK